MSAHATPSHGMRVSYCAVLPDMCFTPRLSITTRWSAGARPGQYMVYTPAPFEGEVGPIDHAVVDNFGDLVRAQA